MVIKSLLCSHRPGRAEDAIAARGAQVPAASAAPTSQASRLIAARAIDFDLFRPRHKCRKPPKKGSFRFHLVMFKLG